MTTPSILLPVRRHFRALTVAFVPAAERLDEAGWLRAEAIVEEALLDRPPAMRRQILLFVRVLDVLTTLRFGRGLSKAPVEGLRRLLGRLERAPVLLLRRGVWGIRTLAYMGCYGQDRVRRSVGYAAAPAGWDALGTDAGAWPTRGDGGRPEATTLTAGPEPHRTGDPEGDLGPPEEGTP